MQVSHKRTFLYKIQTGTPVPVRGGHDCVFRVRLYLDTYAESELISAALQWNYGKVMVVMPSHSSHFLSPLRIPLTLLVFHKLSITHPGTNVWQCFLLIRLFFEKENITLQYSYMCISVHTYPYTYSHTNFVGYQSITGVLFTYSGTSIVNLTMTSVFQFSIAAPCTC